MTDSVRFQHPEALVDVDTLAASLGDPALRIYDCTMYLLADSLDEPYRVQNGLADYLEGHIPGAGYLDLQQLSVPDAPYRFTMPPPATLAAALGAHGLGNDHRVVLYSRGTPQWATRIWWMLRAIGFDNAAILDGGWEAWVAAGLEQATGETPLAPATLTARPRDGLFCDSQQVLAAIDSPTTVTINALSTELHAGRGGRYGRPGRVPSSTNVPAAGLRDPGTGLLVEPARAAAAFAGAGVTPDKRVLIYCGGGIAATLDAFVLHQLGYDNVSVYDNSLSEWATTDSLPIETD